MTKKRKINIFRIIWVTGIFAFLIIVLLMIMDYKINYQYLTRNYLYFYNCSNSVCTARVKDSINKSDLYSTYDCEYESCPTMKKVLENNYAILEKDDKNILYNYKENKIISDSYDDYISLSDKYFIVTKNDYQGLIDQDNNILVSTSYQQLGYYKEDVLLGYNLQNIIVKKNDLYGIISMKDETLVEKIEYKEENINELLKKFE